MLPSTNKTFHPPLSPQKGILLFLESPRIDRNAYSLDPTIPISTPVAKRTVQIRARRPSNRIATVTVYRRGTIIHRPEEVPAIGRTDRRAGKVRRIRCRRRDG